MIITTTDTIQGKNVTNVYGIVEGSATRARHIGSDIGAALKSIVGGEIKGYTKLMEETRAQALTRLQSAAEEVGANAITGCRITTSTIAAGVSEIVAYGTAVTID